MSFGVIYVVIGAIFGITFILVIPYAIIRHNRRSEIAANMKANNARLFHEQEVQRRRSVGDLEYGLNTTTERSSNHGGITGVTQFGSSRAVHDSPQMPPPAYVGNSRGTAPTGRTSQVSQANPSITGGPTSGGISDEHQDRSSSGHHASVLEDPMIVSRTEGDVPPAYSAVVPR